MTVVDAFWEESTPPVRRLLLDEAEGRRSGVALFEFDTMNVRLDFDAGTATVEDSLPESLGAETVPLPGFLNRAATYGDPVTAGDGKTLLERHPATFSVAPDGTAEPTQA